ncbi:MAG: hypothetical protein KIH64_014985 [Mycobacterium sp.]|nr:hypothetical protein [Mycobacterium sp.]
MSKAKRSPFTLVRRDISTDTVECLQSLLQQAQAGDVIGIAYVAMLKERDYIADSTGEAHRSPTFTRGMLRALDDRLGRRVHEGA